MTRTETYFERISAFFTNSYMDVGNKQCAFEAELGHVLKVLNLYFISVIYNCKL